MRSLILKIGFLSAVLFTTLGWLWLLFKSRVASGWSADMVFDHFHWNSAPLLAYSSDFCSAMVCEPGYLLSGEARPADFSVTSGPGTFGGGRLPESTLLYLSRVESPTSDRFVTIRPVPINS
jgi:hypothetical protein